MFSETAPEAVPTQQQDAVVEESLPFSDLAQVDLVRIFPGPRISSIKENPRKYYGPVTIRNYVAGHAKKSLRLSRAKSAPDSIVLLKLPVELQLHVLEHLHPLDLYHLTLVSKSFRKLILDTKALGVWKAAFARHQDLPTPPPRVKESDWAFMIYGPGICCVCGEYGALTDFNFLKRFCGPCLMDHTLPRNAFRDDSNNDIPDQHDIWTLIPKSYRFNGIRYNTYITERFLMTDFFTMWKKLKFIQILIANGVPLVSQLFEEYKTALRDYVQGHHDIAKNANLWALTVFRHFSNEYDNATFQLTEKCKSRLQALGHDAEDVASITTSIRCVFREESIYRLSCKTFRQIKPIIESLVKEVKITRIETERRKLLKGIYQDYLKARPPGEWQYLPEPDTRRILEIEGFKEFLDAPFDERGDISPGYAVAFFPDFIDNWVKGHQEDIVGILPDLEDAEETFEAKVQRLELATSVVTCRDCNDSSHLGLVLVGWKNICRHLRSTSHGYPDNCQTYEVNHHAVAAAASLVSCVGLDPLTTTMDDMNRRDDRFMCGTCLPEDYRGRRFMRVYTWLECLEHTMKMVNLSTDYIEPMHAAPAWLLLSPAATRFVREHVNPNPHPLHHIWGCNHCAQHFENQLPQADVIDHVNRVHCVINPVVGADVAADLRKRIHKRRPFRLFRDPAFEHRCKHCLDLPIYKLWEKDTLMKHLKKKHHINEPVENVDWETEVMIAASSAPTPTTDEPTDGGTSYI